MEYEEEVAKKVWRGKRSRVASAGCGGGDYARRSRSGRRGHNWKESQKNHNPEISVQKMLISMENIGNICCYQGKVKI